MHREIEAIAMGVLPDVQSEIMMPEAGGHYVVDMASELHRVAIEVDGHSACVLNEIWHSRMVLDSMMLCDVISAVTEFMVMVLHSMVLDSTPARLKLVQACGQ
jgi:hypothetical protein